MNKITLTDEHIAAVERQRRIVVNFDVSYTTNTCSQHYDDFDAYVESLFTFTDADGSQIDSIWWNWSEGNQVPYKSEFLPLFDDPRYQQWVADGIDIVDIVLQATHKRGKESFYAHRINGLDNDLGRSRLFQSKSSILSGSSACRSQRTNTMAAGISRCPRSTTMSCEISRKSLNAGRSTGSSSTLPGAWSSRQARVGSTATG